MTEAAAKAHDAIATLVRALKASPEEWLPSLAGSCSAVAKLAASSSWLDVATSRAEALAALAPASRADEPAEARAAAVKAFCASVPADKDADSSSAVLGALLKAARNLVRPGELADPVAARFWSTNFFTSTKPVAFTGYMEKLLKTLQANPPTDMERLCDAFTLERTCMRPLRRSLVGNAADINPLQLQDLIDDSASYSFPGAMLELMRAAAANAAPLDEAFAELLKRTELQNPSAVAHALRDAKLSLHNACKENTAALRANFTAMGMCDADAVALAHRVFQEARARLPVVVRAKSKLDRAREAIEQLDDVVDMSQCGLRVEDARELFDMMRRTGHPRVVDLSSNNLHAEGAQHVADLMLGLPRLRELRLGGNMLQLSGLRKVFNAACKCPTLRVLDASCNHGQAESGPEIFKLLSNSNVTVLRFNGNDLGAAGMKALADAMDTCLAVQELVLGANALCDEGAKEFSTRVLPSLHRLTVLNLRNNGVTDAGIVPLVEALQTRRNIRTVDLRGNAFGVAGTKQLAAAVEEHAVLTHVDVGMCGSAEARDALAKACSARQDATQQIARQLADSPVPKWSTDDVCTWLHIVQQRPGYAMIARSNGINGMRLVAYSDRAMARDGIDSPEERDLILDAVEVALLR